MKILVFGGSPKGDVSVTMQYVKWLQQNVVEHSFEVIQVAQPIRRLERDETAMAEIGEKVRAADGILWAFPLYVAMPHAGVKRFIELITERGVGDAFQAKHCAILTTSIHFYDHTAVEYVRGISEDLGMVVDEVFSAQMQDLTRPGGTEQLAQFFHKWTGCIERGAVVSRRTAAVCHNLKHYESANTLAKVHPIKVGIVTQSGVSANLDNMVKRIAKHFVTTEIYDLSTMHIAGNCTGCLHCGYDYECRYEGKDEVIDTYRKLRECDAILFCGFVVDRYFSARWKTFIDRMFFSTHTPVCPDKPMGFVVAGPLQQLDNLRDILTGVYATMQMRLAGFATDEGADIDGDLAALSESLHFLAQSGYTAPEQFPSICGRKIFRDEVFSGLSGVFPADHRYYKTHGWYDFPQKQVGMRFASFLMRTAMKIPAVRKNMHKNQKTNMLLSYRKVVKQEEHCNNQQLIRGQ